MKLEIKQLDKNFRDKKVLSNINLSIEQGKIYGLLGPNDSGKTTLLKIISGLIKPSQGELKINSLEPSAETKRLISFMPTENYFPKWMKIKDAIDFYQEFYTDFNIEKCKCLLSQESFKIDQKIKTLSTGSHGKLKVILTLSRTAALFVLDEPFNGIDPIAKTSINEIIKKTLNEENTIIISSHLIFDIESLLDHVIILDQGEIVIDYDLELLKKEKKLSLEEIYNEVLNVQINKI